ncbi:carbohydrate ABC transporter permease [Catenulispora yoronensis]|uniref:Carbohydrate ABC transporter permease n=1 Tax=Catenulispora yoronensis TaxID=450799 RepID=A0ABN2VAV0_9ACTN
MSTATRGARAATERDPRTPAAPGTGRRRIPWARLPGTALIWLFVAFCGFAFLFMLLSSLKSSFNVLNHPFRLPTELKFSNWSRAWHDGGFGPAFVNSATVVAVAAAGTVLIASPAAYVLGRNQGRVSGGLSLYFVLGLGIPMQIIVLPLYSIMAKLHLIDNLAGLIVLYIVVNLPFTVYLLMSFFATLPGELEEAAALDGVGPGMTFWRIMLPLAKGGLVTSLILVAIACWNETFLALMFLQTNDNFTLPLALVNFLTQQQFTGQDFGVMFAGVSIAVLPMLALYAWLGRRITEGLTLGAGK